MALLKPATPVAAQQSSDTEERVEQSDPNLTKAFTPSPDQIAAYLATQAGAGAETKAEVLPAETAWEEAPFTQEEHHLGERQPAASKEIATARPRSLATASAAPNLADAGFEGLDIGARSFPIISLKTEGIFEDTDGNVYGKSIRCRLINSRAKTAVQGSKREGNKDVTEVFFTYDGVTTSAGRPVYDVEQELLAKGMQIARREYTDALVTLDDPESEFDGELRILSIAPTSRERLAGKLFALSIQNGWNSTQLTENVGDYVLLVECGAKVTKAVQPFYPWSFKFEK